MLTSSTLSAGMWVVSYQSVRELAQLDADVSPHLNVFCFFFKIPLYSMYVFNLEWWSLMRQNWVFLSREVL